MTNEEIIELNEIKIKYNNLKIIYNDLKKMAKNDKEKESKEYYEILGELSNLSWQLKELRRSIFRLKYGKMFPSEILDKFIFGEYNIDKKRR